MAAPLGNQNGAKGKEWHAALRAAMTHRGEGDYRKILREIAAGVVEKALQGDKDAVMEIANREDGKPHQSSDVALTGDLNVTRTMFGGKPDA